MRKIITVNPLNSFFLISCNQHQSSGKKTIKYMDNKELASLFDKYYAERMQLVPLESTQNGDTVNNDKLYADFTDSYREKYKEFFNHYLNEIKKFNRDDLDDNDKISL